jgi:hypothetical protein
MDNRHESAGHHRACCYRLRARRSTHESDRLLVCPAGGGVIEGAWYGCRATSSGSDETGVLSLSMIVLIAIVADALIRRARQESIMPSPPRDPALDDVAPNSIRPHCL